MDQRPNRKSVRLKKYDYGQPGYYFATICSDNKRETFGSISEGKMEYSPIGAIAAEEVDSIEIYRPNVQVAQWVVMPNHVHMIIHIVGRDMTCHVRLGEAAGTNRFSKPKWDSLGMIVGAYKAAVTRRVRAAMTSHGPTKLWQDRYYEHTVRNEQEYLAIARYIDENPLKSELDEYYQR